MNMMPGGREIQRFPGGFYPGMHPRMGMHHGYGWGFGIAHLIFSLLVLTVLILLIIWLFRAVRHPMVVRTHHMDPVKPDSALEEVRMRYARGEISQEEYQRLHQDLGGGPAKT